LERVLFADGSQLRTIGRSAISNCKTFKTISIPATVTEIEESAFKDCPELESCLIADNASLTRIEREAFSGCQSLRLFSIPKSVEAIGDNCFNSCSSLHQLRLESIHSLERFVGDCTLDETLENMGLCKILGVFRIETSDEGLYFEFPGWLSGIDESLHLAVDQDSP
jgi:hypothetical protein